jgi:hypothetical protein
MCAVISIDIDFYVRLRVRSPTLPYPSLARFSYIHFASSSFFISHFIFEQLEG